MKYWTSQYIFFIFLLVFLCLPAISISQDADAVAKPSRIILFVSKNIRPYVEAADGMADVLAEKAAGEVEVFNLDKMGEKAAQDLAMTLNQDHNVALLAGIGPEAASFTWNSFQNDFPPKIYSIVLNPEKIVGPDPGVCGIPLNIPAHIQLNIIHDAFAAVKRVGVLYDPANNVLFCQDAAAAASAMDMTIVPFPVSSMKDIPALLEKAIVAVDCIWLIPDKTVISESIAQYIIKQAVIRRIPVVGYNQFFYESGSAMSFVFNYGALGRQTGELAGEILRHQAPCASHVPVFEVWLNKGVIEKLGIKIPDMLTSPMKIGP